MRTSTTALFVLLLSCAGGDPPPPAPVASVDVVPPTLSLAPGQTAQLTAVPRDAAGNGLSSRSIAWSSSTSAASVTSAGLVTAVSDGTADITATSEGQSGTAGVTVTTGGGGSVNYALRFYANVLNDQGRVKIRLDDPATNVPGPPADIGATDITIEFWIRGTLAQNGAAAISCGANNNWINGNIVLDRDRFGTDGRDWGLSLGAGRVVFGLTAGSGSDFTICGTSNVLDDQWHHVAVTRRVGTGTLAVFVDGTLEAQANGPAGDISYPDNATPSSTSCSGGSCAFSDPFLVIGAEKHDVVAPTAGFNGLLDELRMSTSVRYTAAFTRPSQRFATDAQTGALYHFDEGQGTVAGDASGAPGGPSNGTLSTGGSPAGPAWAVSTAPTAD